ncbi:hypothetical protein H0H93_013102, partial [Arthromyces matolae]
PAFRRKGFALEALQLILEYATGYPSSYFTARTQPRSAPTNDAEGLGIPPSSLIVRISDTNAPSIRLFESLGFQITRRVEVFEEVELRLKARFRGPTLNFGVFFLTEILAVTYDKKEVTQELHNA